MEEIYILQDGTTVDLSSYSEFDKVKFLLNNPNAKKSKNTAKGASTVLKKKKAPSMDSSSEKSSSESKRKFRLPTEEEYETFKKTQPSKPTYGVTSKKPTAYEDFYNIKAQSTEPLSGGAGGEFTTPRSTTVKRYIPKENWSTWDLVTDEEPADISFRPSVNIPGTNKNVTGTDFPKQKLTTDLEAKNLRLPSEKEFEQSKIKENKNRIELYIKQKQLDTPNIYESYDEGDNFASTLYNTDELTNRNINLNDFNGFLTAKGFKDDIKRFKELELDKSSYTQDYDPQLALEKRKVQYLNAYIDEQIKRDIKRQKLDYEYKNNENPDFKNMKFTPGKFSAKFDLSGYDELLKKEAPLLTAKMVEVDEKNLKNYNDLVSSKGNVGAGKFLSNVLENGWNGLSGAISSFTASGYGLLPGDYFEGISESIRESESIDKMLRGTDYRYVSAVGKKTNFNGIDYITDSFTGEVYDITNKINVTTILTPEEKEKIMNKASKENVRGESVSALGTSFKSAEVIGDLIFQLALTRGTGTSMKAVGGFTEGLGILGKTKGFLRSVPLKRSVVESTIAQSTLGFSKGYEDTLKTAREAGISDTKARELASIAAIETGFWYAATAWINPQSKTTDLLFGKAKNEVLENALNAYASNGKKGFVNTLKDYGKTFLDVSGEGFAELIQENVQQAGETFVINKSINELAGQELLKDTMSLQDFIDTSVLSFVAGSIIPGAGAANTQAKKSMRQLLGMQGVDRFNALNTLATNKSKVSDLLSKQVVEGLYTQEQVDNILSEIDAYSSSINKMPGDISADAAEDILEDVSNLSKLEQKKKEVDKSFHGPIDEQIDEVRGRIQRRYYDDVTAKRTATIKKAIQEGKVGDIEYREFDNESDIVNTLVSDFNYKQEVAEKMAANPGFILTEDNLKKQLSEEKFVPGKKVIFINNSMAADMSQFSVGKHEFLHGLIYETIKGDKEAQILLGKALANEILSIHKDITEGNRQGVAAPQGFLKRFNQYVKKYSSLIETQKVLLESGRITQQQYDNNVDTYLGNQWEEVMTLYSDAIDNGTVVFDEDIFTKIGDMIRRVLQRLGKKDVKFNSGRDVYNFVRDYNASVEKGTFGGSIAKLSVSKAEINKQALRKQVGEKPRKQTQPTITVTPKEDKEFTTEAKFSLKGDRIDPEKFKSKINSYYKKDKWNDTNYLDSTLYEILDDYSITIKQKAKGYGYSYLPDYSEEDMVAETQVALIPVIRNFNKEFFELREEYKDKLKSRGLKPGSKEFNDELESQDAKGYKGKKGIVKENNDLNAYINSLLKFKMMDALKTGSVTSKQYNEDIDSEFFRQSNIEGFDYEESEDMLDDIDSLLDEKQEFEQEQNKLAVLLKDPVFGFTDEDGNPIDIQTVPFGVMYVQDINDQIIPANRKLKKATDPEEIKALENQLKKLKRGLELQAKKELTPEEKEELKTLKSFKSYDLSTGGMINTFEAFSTLDRPSKIISEEIAREILRAPNLETLEYRNFKDKLSLTAQTMARRMTFKNSDSLNKFMYDNWDLIYNVINNPVDPVSGESSYASKKLPPRLKELDENGNFIKRKKMNRTLFLQSYFGDEDTKSIINKYSKNPSSEIKQLEDEEVNEKTGKKLWSTAYFDRRTALMELFGDVLVLQEARRLLREDSFLESIKDRNVNLYNDLKDDIKREAVLNNMAKGKSDIVKYSLAFATNDEIVKLDRKNRFLTKGVLLTPSQIREKNTSISTNPYNFLISPKSIEETVKYSLRDLTSSKLEGYNKKYENHYKEIDPKGLFTNKESRDKWFEIEKKDYVKALMLSDLKDQQPGTKLHTLKSYEEIRKEVERRVDEIVYNLINENYDSKFLYTGAELKRDGLSEDELENQRQDIQSIRLQQNAALGDVFRVIGSKSYYDEESEPIKYYNNIFYTYLFLEDVISNRYSIDYKNKDVSRNKFKTSDFSRTRLPIDVPMDYLLKKSKDLFYESNSLYPLLVYNSYKLEEEEAYKKQWQSKNVANLENGHMAFKFDQSTNKDDQFSLHLFASRNEKSRWCTGDALIYAEQQLSEGDFYIISDKYYTPVIAIRTTNNNGKISIAEIVGTHKSTEFAGVDETQIIKTRSELPLLIEFYNELSKSNELGSTNNKLPDISLFLKNIDNILEEKIEQIKEEFKNEEFIKQFSIFNSRRINLNNRIDIISKFKSIEKKLVDSGFIEAFNPDSIFKIQDLDEDSVAVVVDLADDQTLDVNDVEGILQGDYIDLLSKTADLNEVLENIKYEQGKEVELTIKNGDFQDYMLEIKNIENLGKTVFQDFPYIHLPNLIQAQSIIMDNVTIKDSWWPLLSAPQGLDIGVLDISAEFENGGSKDVIVSDLDLMADYFAISFTGNDKDSDSNYSVDVSKVFSDNGVSIYGEYIDTVFTPKIMTQLDIEYNDRLTIVNLENAGILRLRLNKNNTNTFNLDDVEFLGKNETKIKKLIIVPEFIEEVDYDINELISNLQKSKNNSVFERIDIFLMKNAGAKVIVKDANNNIQLGDVKFSLAEEENAKSSEYLENLNLEDQLFTAKVIDKAVTNARNISKKSTKFKVPNLKGMNDKARSFFLIDKVANGYNDFEFLNKEDSKGKLTQNVLNTSDIKFSLASENAEYNNDLEVAMNEIIQENKGIDVNKKYSPETAKNIGKNVGRYEIWLPPSDDDFVGLLYRLAEGKGKVGEKQIEFFEKNLIKPYSTAMLNLMHERQAMYKDWTNLINKKYKNISKRLKKDSGYEGYTIDQAIRVFLWDKAGYEVPGLDAKDVFHLKQIVRKDKELRDFATDVSYISKQPNGYIEPDTNWGFGSLISDLHGEAQKASRKKYLEHWQHNVDKIFSKDNLSKIEALYGREYVLALKNSLDRMKSGSNRVEGGNDTFLNWLNAATGVTMFFNMRSAVLQTMSMVNFINTGDNNPLKVSARMLDVKQFSEDYITLWNSDYLKDRRSNLMSDVAEAELAQAMNDPRNKDVLDKFKAGYYFIMKQGFIPTRVADSFAIAFGGASFYRNRINTYLKQGDTQEDAEKKAMRDFYETAEASQQSADVSKISKNQASLKGRLIFAFQNTPLQYSRLITRAVIDIAKGRGDLKSNIAKVVYYSAIQNILFNFMQNALFSLMFDDEDEQKAQEMTGKVRAFNGALDSLLRGSGLTGAVISTVKNTIIKWYEIHGDPKQGGEVVVEALNISPPIGIKARKITKAYKAIEYNADEIKYKGFSIDNTYAIEATTTITSAAFNLPVDRIYQKSVNVGDAIYGDFDTWERIALIFGYSKWNLGKGQTGAGLEPTGNGTLRQPELQQAELEQGELKQ